MMLVHVPRKRPKTPLKRLSCNVRELVKGLLQPVHSRLDIAPRINPGAAQLGLISRSHQVELEDRNLVGQINPGCN